MNLKEHNDIVQKLIKQLDSKERQINTLRKQMRKGPSQDPRIQPSSQQIKLNKKISQLNKEHKERVNQLNQQLRSKSNENKELKEKFATKKNKQLKEKEHVAEIVKKKFEQKASNGYDHKVNSLISHYEYELEKKTKHIENLQKQIKQSYYSSRQDQTTQNVPEGINQKHVENQKDYHFKYQTEINTLKKQVNKYQKLFQQRSKQFKDLTKKYSELTRDYYKIINEYGCDEKQQKQKHEHKKTIDNFKRKSNNVNKQEGKKTGIHNLLSEMVEDNENQESLAYSFATNLSKINSEPQDRKQQVHNQYEFLVENIMEILEIKKQNQIVSTISKMKSKFQEFSLFEGISKFMHSMLYRLGMGKIPMTEMYGELEKLQDRIDKMAESSDILDELCIQIGAKKNKVLQKLKDLKATEEQFFMNMKDIKFMHQLPKANKIMQFIEYFQLDRQILELPEQLKKMYEQLKYVERFIKQSNIILQKESTGLERSLEGILRYLERKKTEEDMTVLSEKIKKK